MTYTRVQRTQSFTTSTAAVRDDLLIFYCFENACLFQPDFLLQKY